MSTRSVNRIVAITIGSAAAAIWVAACTDDAASPAGSPSLDAQAPDAQRDVLVEDVRSATEDAADARREDASDDGPVSCAPGLLACQGKCVDSNADGNCGACGVTCGAGTFCSFRKCIAPSVGCSDGVRDAFADLGLYPGIAGCRGAYPSASLRAPKTGAACGEFSGSCAAPADLCATGWHICGVPPYGAADVSLRLTQSACDSVFGEYLAALGNEACEPCGTANGQGAACCGTLCIRQLGDCIWPHGTSWSGSIDNHVNTCGESRNDFPSYYGVLCCRD